MFKLVNSLLMATIVSGLMATAAVADDHKMKRDGDYYTIELTGEYNFLAVVDMLQIRLFEQGWEIRNVHDVDLRLRSQGHLVHNKVITTSKPKYITANEEKGGRSALVIPTDIVVYEKYSGVEEEFSYRSSPGTIVIGFIDPAARAEIVGWDKEKLARKAREEIETAVEETAEFFRRGDVRK